MVQTGILFHTYRLPNMSYHFFPISLHKLCTVLYFAESWEAGQGMTHSLPCPFSLRYEVYVVKQGKRKDTLRRPQQRFDTFNFEFQFLSKGCEIKIPEQCGISLDLTDLELRKKQKAAYRFQKLQYNYSKMHVPCRHQNLHQQPKPNFFDKLQ